MKNCILSIDQGTSSCRAIVFNPEGGVEVIFQREFPLHYPHSGWVEQNPADLLEGTEWALKGCAEYCQKHDLKIVAAGITNQRETTILWERSTGAPIYNAIVWQDRRTSEYCTTLRESGVEDAVRSKTGLLLDPYFSATKIRWILDNVPGARKRAASGEICFGTVDSFLLWHLTTDKIHVTDSTNASRTMIFDVQKCEWSDELLKIFDIYREVLPSAKSCISDFGQLKSDYFGYKIPIMGIAGDQQAALVGQGCINTGMMKSTYGTGCFALMNIGADFKPSRNRLLTTIAYHIKNEVVYAIEGSIFNAGTAIQFLRDNLGIISAASETENLARSVDDHGGVYFVPALTGLGAPYWQPEARGLICGLDRHTSKAHIVRAALEAQGYQTRDLIAAMEEDSGAAINTIRADGGLVANNFMVQFLSDITQCRVELPQFKEATAWGAACLAGIGAGVYRDLAHASSLWRASQTFTPQRSSADTDVLHAGWKKSVARTIA